MAIGFAVEGGRLGDICASVEAHVAAHGFTVVREFVGHGVGRKLHEEPQVPNFGKPRTGPRLKAGMTLAIEPIGTMSDDDWRWFIGLDSTGTRIGNALWNSEWMPDELKQRAVAFYRAQIDQQLPLLPEVAGHPLYLILGMDADGHIMVKPQNLIAGLPLKRTN